MLIRFKDKGRRGDFRDMAKVERNDAIGTATKRRNWMRTKQYCDGKLQATMYAVLFNDAPCCFQLMVSEQWRTV